MPASAHLRLATAALSLALTAHAAAPSDAQQRLLTACGSTTTLRDCPVPDWFRDAKLGIWSHWGPDSVPGNSNGYADAMYQQGSPEYKWHLQHYGHPSKVGYKDVIASWKAEHFDPDALMALYKAAGAKYFVALATHHDNFDNFDSSANPWNAVKVGPHKDIVGLWRDATLKAGLRFGVSSHADDRGWNYLWRSHTSDTTGPLAGVPYDGADPAYQSLYNTAKGPKDPPSQDWLNRWLIRHTELIDKYHPDLLYFDGGIPHGALGQNLVEHYLNANRAAHHGKLEAVLNVKDESFVRDYERGMPTFERDKPFQDDTSLGGWFYLADPIADRMSKSKSATTVIHTLADVVSKNGNLLLNMPQRGDGSLYPECVNVLTEMAAWMKVNGESIFGTRPWIIYGEGPSVLPKAAYMNELQQPLTVDDVRFTTKDGFLYAIVLGVPSKAITIASLGRLGQHIHSITLLGSNEKLQFKQDWDGLTIQPVQHWPTQHAVVFKIQLG
jgi:alpha-L-fucosidase